MAGHRIVLVAVHTFQVDGLAIDQQLSALDLHLAKAHEMAGHFDGLAVCVPQFQQQSVQVRRFGRPFIRIVQLHRGRLAEQFALAGYRQILALNGGHFPATWMFLQGEMQTATT